MWTNTSVAQISASQCRYTSFRNTPNHTKLASTDPQPSVGMIARRSQRTFLELIQINFPKIKGKKKYKIAKTEVGKPATHSWIFTVVGFRRQRYCPLFAEYLVVLLAGDQVHFFHFAHCSSVLSIFVNLSSSSWNHLCQEIQPPFWLASGDGM